MGNKPTSPKEEVSPYTKDSKGSNRSSTHKSTGRRISVNISKMDDDSDLSDVDESDLQDVCAWIDSESKVQASSFHALKSSVELPASIKAIMYRPFEKANLDDSARKEFFNMCYEGHFKPGEVLIKKNEKVNTFYMIISGCIYVEDFGFDEMYIDGIHLYEGNSFGQLSILNHEPCFTTITAKCKCMKSEDLLKFCEKYPTIVDPLLEVQNMLLSKCKLEKQVITLKERPSLKSTILQPQNPSTYSSKEIWINNFLILQELSTGSHNRALLVKHINHQLFVIRTPIKKSRNNKNPLSRKTNLFSTTTEQILENEIHFQGLLYHPNIVVLYEIIRDSSSNRYYLVLEYCWKGDLEGIIKKVKKLSSRDAWLYTRDIVSALTYLHNKNIAHRDLTPSNIFISMQNTAKLSDFGMAGELTSTSDTLQYFGTPVYMPPEVLTRSENSGEKLDIWSLGIIVYYMVYGNLPFLDANWNILIKKVVTEPVTYPFNSEIDPYLLHFMKCLLQKEPSKRYSISQIRNHEWITSLNKVPLTEFIISSQTDASEQNFFSFDENIYTSSPSHYHHSHHNSDINKIFKLKTSISDLNTSKKTRSKSMKATSHYHLDSGVSYNRSNEITPQLLLPLSRRASNELDLLIEHSFYTPTASSPKSLSVSVSPENKSRRMSTIKDDELVRTVDEKNNLQYHFSDNYKQYVAPNPKKLLKRIQSLEKKQVDTPNSTDDLEEDLEIDNIKLEPIEIEDIQFKSYTQYKKPPKGKNPIIYGYCLDQGLRNEMEDTYYCKRHIFTDSAKNYFSLFTLCDGHNGLFSSEYASKILPLILKNELNNSSDDIANQLKRSIIEVDKMILSTAVQNEDESGTTIITLLLKFNYLTQTISLYCENVGDSLGILCKNGKAIDLSETHRVSNPTEKKKLKEKNAIIKDDRLFLTLALSRALGDLPYKRKDNHVVYDGYLVADPYVYQKMVENDDYFVILATDGLWDVMTPQQAVNYVSNHLIATNYDVDKVSRLLIDKALELNATDNISVILIVFTR